jgi:hypothetical protein
MLVSGTTVADAIDSNPGTISGGFTTYPTTFTISTITVAVSFTATVTLASPTSAIAVGDSILIAGNTSSPFNGTWVVRSVPNPTTFTFVASSNVTPIGTGGTVTDQTILGIACNPSSGTGCNITTALQYTQPQPFSFIFSFSGNYGGIIQFGNASSQTATAVYYAAYLDTSGHLTFGVLNYGLNYVIQSQRSYSDGNRHVAIVSLGSAGMKMYVDGFLVAQRSVQLANFTQGYWFFGGMNPAGWPYASSPYFNGSLYYGAWWGNIQLSDFVAEQATQPYATPIPNNYCSFTGNIASVVQPPGYAYANQPVTITVQNQAPQCGSTSPIAYSYQTYTTDSQGNLPSGILIPQGASFNLGISLGPPIPLVAPCSANCPLNLFYPTATATSTMTPTATATATVTATLTVTATPTPTPVALPCLSGGQQIGFNISTCNAVGSATLTTRAGDTLYVAAGNNGTGASQVVWISDSQGDVWNANDMLNAEGTIQSAAIGSSFNVAGGPTTVTVQIAGGTVCNTNVYLIETPPTNALDVTAKNQSPASGTFDSGTTGPTYGIQEFALAVTGQNGNALSFGPTAGFTELNDPTNNQSFAACNVVPLGTDVDTQWTPISFSGSYAAGVAAYKLIVTATPTGGVTPTPTASPTPTSPPQFVQTISGSHTATSGTLTFRSNASIGDTVFLSLNVDAAGTPSVSGLGATWVQLGALTPGSTGLGTYLYAGSVTSSGKTVNFSGLSATATYLASIADFAGMPTTVTQDGSATTGSSNGAATIQPSPYMNANPNDVVFCTAMTGNTNSFASQPTAPWVTIGPVVDGSFLVAGSTFQIVSNRGSFQPSWGNGSLWNAMCAAVEW